MCLNTLTTKEEIYIKGYLSNDKSNKEMNHITRNFVASSFSPYINIFFLKVLFGLQKSKGTLGGI